MKRRNFIIKTLKGSLITSLPLSLSSFNLKNNKVEIGVVADVHQDIIHDGFSRLSFFIFIKRNFRYYVLKKKHKKKTNLTKRN